MFRVKGRIGSQSLMVFSTGDYSIRKDAKKAVVRESVQVPSDTDKTGIELLKFPVFCDLGEFIVMLGDVVTPVCKNDVVCDKEIGHIFDESRCGPFGGNVITLRMGQTKYFREGNTQ